MLFFVENLHIFYAYEVIMIFENCFQSEKDKEEIFDISQKLSTASNNIYDVPCDSLPEEPVTCKTVKDRGKNEDNGYNYLFKKEHTQILI